MASCLLLLLLWLSARVDCGHQPASEQVGAAGSKFQRTRELEAFLDDMNHNELRTVAAGKPIGDLFQAKPMQSPSRPGPGREPEPGPEAEGGRSGEGAGAGLAASQSEQQIYSECALILQRTYVKNIDEPT